MPYSPRPGRWRPAWVDIDLGAVCHNARLLADRCAPAALCAVVKADGYGHGAEPVARAALAAGASWLAVALVEEGTALRRSGIGAPVLLLSEPAPEAMGAALAAGLTPTLYTPAGVAAAARAASRSAPVAVHLKVDTGMHRVGVDPAGLVDLARAVLDAPSLVLDGLWTHLAVADDPDQDSFTNGQLARFEAARASLRVEGMDAGLTLHAANSAGALAFPAARYDMVRCGIAIYGHAPGRGPARHADLRPALSFTSTVSLVRRLAAGERVSYGRRYAVGEDASVATVPVGYADGVPRRLSAVGGEVLVGGRRRPIAGTVTMDQILVDCGPDADVAVGDEVVLLGRQGTEEVTVAEWADRLETISYEVLCGIGPRVPRVAHDEPGGP